MTTSEAPGYRVLRADELPALLAAIPALRARLGGDAGQWQVRDVADGNLNAVYLVDGPLGGVCVKQALPWLRVAGDSWPLPVERADFESAYMRRVEPLVGDLAPRWLHFDPVLHVLVMEKLAPHVILRQGLIQRRQYPGAARAVADYVAATAFHTSDLAQPFERKSEDIALFARNTALQRITVDLVFTDPYTDAPRNHWTPGLDAWAAALRDDIALKTVVARHRVSFLTNTQALIHGDLHSGSVMVTDDDTRVIDGEFAALGPVGFDLGAFIAHLLMSWFAQSAAGEAARSQCDWLLAQVVSFWERFDRQFRALWEAHAEGGDAFPASHFKTSAGQARLATIRHETVARIFGDTLAYAAIKIIRRNVGFAQVADFLAIDDLPARAHAQAGALSLARSLLLAPQAFPDIDAVATAVSRHALAGLDPASLRPQGRAARP